MAKPTGAGARGTHRPRDPSGPTVRRATLRDLDALVRLYGSCFEPYRRASRGSLRRSLASQRQSVWVMDGDGGELAGALVLWHLPQALRVYDLATNPNARGQGIGGRLMGHAEATARRDGAKRILLEAEEQDPLLVGWYEARGFRQAARLKDYYHQGCSALRLEKAL